MCRRRGAEATRGEEEEWVRLAGELGGSYLAVETLLERAYPEGHPRRFSGDLLTAEPEIQVASLGQAHAFVVLATDGLWDVLDGEEAVRVVDGLLKGGKAPQECCAASTQALMALTHAEQMGGAAVSRRTACGRARNSASHDTPRPTSTT